MPLKSYKKFFNVIRFAKKIYKELEMEESIVGFLYNLAKRNLDFLFRHITYITNKFPEFKKDCFKVMRR
jgi:hypothetical protein